MKRWLPHPLMAGLLLLAWLLLAQRVTVGTVVVGVVVALGLSWVFGRLQPPPLRIRRPGLLVTLLAHVVVDIVRSNFAVALIIITRRIRPRSGFVAIPLEITNPYALAMLACIITATPGTIWVSHDSAQRMLVIHVLDLIDDETWITRIQQRYERPLGEIFQ
jgi:multicomponent K+:H+ antiporter subunit E